MKKLICLLLAIVTLITAACATFTVMAETDSEETKAFVIDGKLDEWYRDDDWAEENNCYFYFNGMDDTTLDIISKEPGQPNGVQDLMEFYEDVKVKIYVAYDEKYAYFYVDVEDPDIATSFKNADGTTNEYSQYIENIDFFVDTDIMSAEGSFTDNINTHENADTHFRMIAHNLAVTDMQGNVTKYSLAEENEQTVDLYFKSTENVFPFHKKDADGNLIGYGCEARFPLAYRFGGEYAELYQNFYFHVAVANHATDDDPTRCAITTGKRWWLAYDTGKTVELNVDEPNPFFNKPDPNQLAADEVNALLRELPSPEDVDLKALNEIRAARTAYDALNDDAKALVEKEELANLVACEETLNTVITAAAKAMDEQIATLPALDELTLEDEEAVETVRDAYDDLPEEVQKQVTTLAALEAAEAKIQSLPRYEMGDVTLDNTVNAKDALDVLKYAVDKIELTDEQFALGDMNTDSKLDATDALAILKKAVGK